MIIYQIYFKDWGRYCFTFLRRSPWLLSSSAIDKNTLWVFEYLLRGLNCARLEVREEVNSEWVEEAEGEFKTYFRMQEKLDERKYSMPNANRLNWIEKEFFECVPTYKLHFEVNNFLNYWSMRLVWSWFQTSLNEKYEIF